MGVPSFHDPRMRGFRRRAEVEEVVRHLAERVRRLPAEEAAVEEGLGRVLAEPAVARHAVPAFHRAAMDGFAVRAEDTTSASALDPVFLRLAGEARPARPFPGAVGPGEAVRIATGAPLPAGADAVLPAEDAREDREGGRVAAQAAVARGRHVGRAGEDVAAGERLLEAGRVLRPQDVACLAACGLGRLRVVSRPRAAVLATGDELVPHDAPPREWTVVDSNSLLLRGLLARDGARPPSVRRLADDRDLLRRALAEASAEADAVLVSGGSSVGPEDHVPSLVAELGELAFHGIAMRPSSPAGLGWIAGRPVFLLPGNPVSCLSGYEFFAGPALRAMGGRSMEWPHRRVFLPLAAKIPSEPGRVDFVRVRVEAGRVQRVAVSGASLLSSTVRADGVVVVPADLEGYAEGETVEVRLFGEP